MKIFSRIAVPMALLAGFALASVISSLLAEQRRGQGRARLQVALNDWEGDGGSVAKNVAISITETEVTPP